MLKNKTEDYFSKDFKDLVQKMMCYEKGNNKRINMEEILNHPWMVNQTLPTKDELIIEFNERKKKVDEAMEEERK